MENTALSTEENYVASLQAEINKTTTKQIMISRLGDKQSPCRMPDSIKKKYGSLKGFVANHPNDFQIKKDGSNIAITNTVQHNTTIASIPSIPTIGNRPTVDVSEQDYITELAHAINETASKQLLLSCLRTPRALVKVPSDVDKEYPKIKSLIAKYPKVFKVVEHSIELMGGFENHLPAVNVDMTATATTSATSMATSLCDQSNQLSNLSVTANNNESTFHIVHCEANDREVQHKSELLTMSKVLKLLKNDSPCACIDLEWDPSRTLSLIQFCDASNEALLLDPIKDDKEEVLDLLLQLIRTKKVILLHDCTHDSMILGKAFVTNEVLNNVQFLDTQLAYEVQTSDIKGGLNQLLTSCGIAPYQEKRSTQQSMHADHNFWTTRPLSSNKIHYAALDVLLLFRAYATLQQKLSTECSEMLYAATKQRMLNAVFEAGKRGIHFAASCDYRIISKELAAWFREPTSMIDAESTEHAAAASHTSESMSTLGMKCDLDCIVRLLPQQYRDWYNEGDDTTRQRWSKETRDIVFYVGKQPYLITMDDQRHPLHVHCDTPVVLADLLSITNGVGDFGPDNRAGINQQLHRISAIRNKKEDIIGITIRVGRLFSGNAYIIADLLLDPKYADQSILVLGPPGSGKTSMVREMTRILSHQKTVIVVDTSNEICGDGDVMHDCVGEARRMMVPNVENQYRVMIECVQNHSPTVMVIDEIGRPQEAIAARTCKTRGVRMIASAHGDFVNLLQNHEMQDLLGGKTSVIHGDLKAKETGKKVAPKRNDPPTFEIVVELRKGVFNEVRVIKDVAKAVDRVFDGKDFICEQRKVVVESGNELQQNVFMEYHRVDPTSFV